MRPSFDILEVSLKRPAATSVAVERVFSRGRILLSHLRNRLSAQSVHALLCLGDWSRLNLISDADIQAITSIPEDKNEETIEEWEDGWDRINLSR